MIYVGRFSETDLTNGVDKKAVAKKQKETGLKYTQTQLVTKNKKIVGIDIWVCDMEEFSI